MQLTTQSTVPEEEGSEDMEGASEHHHVPWSIVLSIAALFIALLAAGAVIWVSVRYDYRLDSLDDAYSEIGDRVGDLESWREMQKPGAVVPLSALKKEVPPKEFSDLEVVSDAALIPPEEEAGEQEIERTLMPTGYHDCEAVGRGDDASALVHYENTNIGIALNVPFNPEWGTNLYYVEPVVEGDGFIQFGRAHLFEGCAFVREYTMAIRPPVAMADRVQSLQESGFEPVVIDLGGNEGIGYVEESGLCPNYIVEVFGSNHHVRLLPSCGDDEKIRIGLTEIAATISL